MTQAQETYAATLNLLGSDVLDPVLQEIVDHEHALADPEFQKLLEERAG